MFANSKLIQYLKLELGNRYVYRCLIVAVSNQRTSPLSEIGNNKNFVINRVSPTLYIFHLIFIG